MNDEARRQDLRECTVCLRLGSEQGTGFFVAPGLILTCAHVVAGAGSRSIDVFWKTENQNYTAKVEQLREDWTLDLALLRLESEVSNHPYVDFELASPQTDDDLYIFGYPKECGVDYSDGDSETFQYAGESYKGKVLWHKLRGDLIASGFSGSPLLNLRTDRVCGIVHLCGNTSGGRAVSAREILWQFPELAVQSRLLVNVKQDYIYDIFLSYRRKGAVLKWVHNHFRPMLEEWLTTFIGEPRIFIDEQPETDTKWPDDICNALQMSRCLLPVWSPDYFLSPWCLAELHSVRERERLLGFRTEQNPSRLIYPVVFCDGKNFPPEFQRIQRKDLSQWNCTEPFFRNTAAIVDFDREVGSVAEALGQLIQKAPDWQENWPIIRPTADLSVTVKLPRFR